MGKQQILKRIRRLGEVPSSQKPLVLLHASGSDVKGSTQDSRFSSLEPHNAPPTRPPGLFLPSGRSDL